MSTVGMMEGAFFVPRSELLAWANDTFCLSLTKVEQCANGAVYCHVIDACHPGAVMMKKVNWSARVDHECIPNYKVLQQALDKSGIQRHIAVEQLVRGKYQDNLEMLQWIKAYFDRTFPGGEYDALARRNCGDKVPEWARPSSGAQGFKPSDRPKTGSKPPSSAGPRQPARVAAAATPSRAVGGSQARGGAMRQAKDTVPREEYESLQEENAELGGTLDDLERERDYYFQKLRDVEMLCQSLETTPDSNMTVAKFAEDLQRILYAKDDDEECPQNEALP